MIKLNEHKKFKVVAVLESGATRDLTPDETAAFSDTNDEIANGPVAHGFVFLANAYGTDTVTVTALGFTASIDLTVEDPVSGLQIVEDNA